MHSISSQKNKTIDDNTNIDGNTNVELGDSFVKYHNKKILRERRLLEKKRAAENKPKIEKNQKDFKNFMKNKKMLQESGCSKDLATFFFENDSHKSKKLIKKLNKHNLSFIENIEYTNNKIKRSQFKNLQQLENIRELIPSNQPNHLLDSLITNDNAQEWENTEKFFQLLQFSTLPFCFGTGVISSKLFKNLIHVEEKKDTMDQRDKMGNKGNKIKIIFSIDAKF
jgi:hypothetical protein